MKEVLVTGAAGSIGTMLREAYAGRYALRLTDRMPIADLRVGEGFLPGDVASLEDILRATESVDAIVHLAGWPVEGDWDTVLAANIVGTYNVLEAARRNGVPRVVYASSNHAVGFYRRDERIDHRACPKPDSRYGVSKVCGEALCSLYADRYGLATFVVRIGHAAPAPVDVRRLAIWTSPRDLAQLVAIGLEHPDVRFEVVYGISGNTRAWYDNANAHRLGYRPQDDSEPWAAALLARHVEHADPRVARYQGGPFTITEAGGDAPPAVPGGQSKE